MILRRDHGKFLAAVAVTFEIGLGDPAEDPREAERIRLLPVVAAAEQNVRKHAAWQGRHLLGADNQGNASAAALDEVQCRVQGGGAGCTGILDVDRRREAQFRLAERDQARFEALWRQAIVEDAHGAEVDVLRGNAGMVERRAGDACDQALDVGRIKLAERRVRPTDDTGALCHEISPEQK